ncbi:MAG TPA: acyl-CoA dehydrogenase [Spirochaetota bacterium]|nr:acyl-CoA dehydrogenase [Spirochaetota bacterium]
MDRIVDSRDQKFVLFELLKVQDLTKTEKFADFDQEMFEMTLDLTKQICEEHVLGCYQEVDSEGGAKFDNGKVTIPHQYHNVHKIMNEAGLFTMGVDPESGGQGMPYSICLASYEYYSFHMGFMLYPEATAGAAHLIDVFGTERQKKLYMEKMYAQEWGGTMCLTEADAGSDVGALKTKAVKQPDGTYKISGAKIFITSGENDLFKNIVHPVLARIEGDPAGTKGISIFIVPKYRVKDDGSMGEFNDVHCTGIEHKMGLKGSATCSMSFGDNNDCIGELLGEERKGMAIMFQMMNEARIGMGLQGASTSSVSYLHALAYAKERVQGKNIKDMMNPDAPNVPIIQHPDVRRMLMWMKSHTEGLRALVYLCSLCLDKAHASSGEEVDKWSGIMDFLIPVCKAYGTDMGFRVTELGIQCFGGYGFCNDYPMHQFMRDLKIASLYEGTNGIQALDLVGRKLGAKKGAVFMNYLSEMNKTFDAYKGDARLGDMAKDVKEYIDLMAAMGMYFAACGKEGKFMIPITNAYPFLNLVGCVSLAWLHLWMAGVAEEKLQAIYKAKGIDPTDKKALKALPAEDKEVAFYQGKVFSAEYYIKNILPTSKSYAEAIRKEDMSLMKIDDASFACGENL